MKEIEAYHIIYNARANEGQIMLKMKDGGVESVLLDSPSEGTLLLDILRNESPVYYDEEHGLVMTGIEGVGEGEV